MPLGDPGPHRPRRPRSDDHRGRSGRPRVHGGGRPVFTPFGEDEVSPAFNGAVLLPGPTGCATGGTRSTARRTRSRSRSRTAGPRCTASRAGSAGRSSSTSPRARRSSCTCRRPRLPVRPRRARDLLARRRGAARPRPHDERRERDRPYGVGFHPWLSADGADLDACTLRLDAATRVTTDERLLPTGTEPAAGTFDLREPRLLAGVDLDDAYVDALRDEDGLS